MILLKISHQMGIKQIHQNKKVIGKNIMEEQIVSKDELVEMFSLGVLEDHETRGWLLYEQEIQIIALHETDPKYMQDVTNAEYYKLVPVKKQKE